MTLFGRTLDGQEIAALVSLLLMLVLWIIVWRDNRRETNGFKVWNEARKARRDAGIAAEGGTGDPASEKLEPRGPWG